MSFPKQLFLGSSTATSILPRCPPSLGCLLPTQFVMSSSITNYKESSLNSTDSLLSEKPHHIGCTLNYHRCLYPLFCIVPPPSRSRSRATHARLLFPDHPSLPRNRAPPAFTSQLPPPTDEFALNQELSLVPALLSRFTAFVRSGYRRGG